MKRVQKEVTSRVKSFGYAFEGCWYVLRTQPNTWIHALATALAVVLGFIFQITTVEWGLVIVAITFVWMGEFFNTAIEAVVDMASPEYHPLAKVAKDVAAAGVLVGAIGSIAIALIVFGPQLLSIIFGR